MLCRSVKPLPRYRDFWIFQDGGCRHFGFLKFLIFTVATVKKVKLRHYAKFHRNRSNRGRDMAIFRFFKMAVAAILDFRNFQILTVGAVKRVDLRHRAKFAKIARIAAEIWRFLRFF